MAPEVQRRLAAIMFTDIVGYTSLMAESEEKGLRVRARHRDVVRLLVAQYHGEWVQDVGDESLSSFPSAVDAVNCALAIQAALQDEREFRVRVGIHLGDVVLSEGSLHGDGVNVASRIRPLAEPGAICVSEPVFDSAKNQPNLAFRPLGQQTLKNVERPVGVYVVQGIAAEPRPRVSAALKRRPGTAARWVTGGAALVLISLAAWWLGRPVLDTSPIRSIAVLPLENLSGDAEQEYFSDGMTEALIAGLANISALRVISRTSVMQYKGVRRPLPEIARELGVDAIVEGSVLRADDSVRITAQLIHARDDRHLWSDTYERELSGVLAIQSEVARAIAEEIRVELTPGESAAFESQHRVDPEAHEAVLRAAYFFSQQTPQGFKKAKLHCERAIELDPDYARAYAILAAAYS